MIESLYILRINAAAMANRKIKERGGKQKKNRMDGKIIINNFGESYKQNRD